MSPHTVEAVSRFLNEVSLALSRLADSISADRGPTPEQNESASVIVQLRELKAKSNRSWVMLYRGLLDLADQPVQHSTPAVASSSRSFARSAMKITTRTAPELLEILREKGWGVEAPDLQ